MPALSTSSSGFAPLKPAEFVVLQIQQIAGQLASLTPERGGFRHGAIHRELYALRSVQELQVPPEVGRSVCRRHQQGDSALKRTTEVVKHREGGDPSTSRKSPGRTEFDAITLERGVTHDTAFEAWASKVWNFGAGLGAEISLQDFRKDIILEFYNEAGQLAIAYIDLPLLGVGIPVAPGPGRQRQRSRHSAHEARERGLGARRFDAGADTAQLHLSSPGGDGETISWRGPPTC